jgi:hypothetical protein
LAIAASCVTACPASYNVAARTVSRCEVSTRVAMSASRNATAWCSMIGTPNCTRCAA